jgi:hypothetical protein
MSKLIEKMKKEAERLKKKEAERGEYGPKVEWYQPQVGEHMIRILPNLKNDEELPYKQVRVHFINVKKKDGSFAKIPVRCLEDFEEQCPLCQEHEKLRKTDNEAAKDLRATERYIYMIIDYATKTVKPWQAGIRVHTSIVEFFGDLADTALKRDWKLTKKQNGKSKMAIDYTIRPSMKETDIPAKLEALVEEAVDIDTLFATNEKKKMLEFLGADVDEDTDVDHDEEDDRAAKAKAAAAKAKAAKAKAAAVEEDEDDDRSGGFEDEEDHFPEDKPAKKAAAKPAAKPVKKKVEEEDEDLDIDAEDEDLEEELRSLGVE